MTVYTICGVVIGRTYYGGHDVGKVAEIQAATCELLSMLDCKHLLNSCKGMITNDNGDREYDSYLEWLDMMGMADCVKMR